MPSYNKVLLMGNITRDLEFKYLPSGTALCKSGLAVNEYYNDKSSNERKEIVHFFEFEMFGRQAEVLNEYSGKGKPIFIEGSLIQNRWQTEDGSNRSKVIVRLFRFQFLGSKDEPSEESVDEYPTQQQQTSPTPAPEQNANSTPAPTEEIDSYPDDSSVNSDHIPF